MSECDYKSCPDLQFTSVTQILPPFAGKLTYHFGVRSNRGTTKTPNPQDFSQVLLLKDSGVYN